MKNKKELKVKFKTNKAFGLKSLKDKLSKPLYKRLESAIKRQMKELKYHFKRDGWDIDTLHTIDDIWNEVIGIDLVLVLAIEYGKFAKLDVKNGQTVWRKK